MKASIKESGEPLSEAVLAQAERRMGLRIPLEYRNFLLAHNGGYPEPSSFRVPDVTEVDQESWATVDWFLGLRADKIDDLVDYVNRYHNRLPPALFPIGHDPFGNLICLSAAGQDIGRVYFWDHEYEAAEGQEPSYANVFLLADSFHEFLNKLTE
jgi:hypothetical protein